MKKIISAVLLSTSMMACSMEANASNLGIYEYNGPQTSKTQPEYGNRDDARSPASYTANVTYIQLLDMASRSVLNPKDYTFFMGVCNAFSHNSSGNSKSFGFTKYHYFINLCDRVNACKLPSMAMTAEAMKTGSSDSSLRAFDLDYAIATIRREAYTAKENGR